MKHKHQQLINELEILDLQGVKFKQAKEQLLAKGYAEEEIDHAIYSAPHDGKANKPKPEHEHTAAYRNNPEHADKVAKELLKQEKKNRNSRTRHRFWANAAASRFAPGAHASSRYAYQAAASIGFPFFTSLFLSAGWTALVIYQHWSAVVLQIGVFIIFVLLYLKSRIF